MPIKSPDTNSKRPDFGPNTERLRIPPEVTISQLNALQSIYTTRNQTPELQPQNKRSRGRPRNPKAKFSLIRKCVHCKNHYHIDQFSVSIINYIYKRVIQNLPALDSFTRCQFCETYRNQRFNGFKNKTYRNPSLKVNNELMLKRLHSKQVYKWYGTRSKEDGTRALLYIKLSTEKPNYRLEVWEIKNPDISLQMPDRIRKQMLATEVKIIDMWFGHHKGQMVSKLILDLFRIMSIRIHIYGMKESEFNELPHFEELASGSLRPDLKLKFTKEVNEYIAKDKAYRKAENKRYAKALALRQLSTD